MNAQLVNIDMALVLTLLGAPILGGLVAALKGALRAWSPWFDGSEGSRVVAALAPALALLASLIPWPGLPWELRLVALLGAAGIAVPSHGMLKARDGLVVLLATGLAVTACGGAAADGPLVQWGSARVYGSAEVARGDKGEVDVTGEAGVETDLRVLGQSIRLGVQWSPGVLGLCAGWQAMAVPLCVKIPLGGEADAGVEPDAGVGNAPRPWRLGYPTPDRVPDNLQRGMPTWES